METAARLGEVAGPPLFHAAPEDIPAVPGAYILAVALAEPLPLRLLRRPETVLPAGFYYYCGSAYGPGGLRGRLARHMRRGKIRRWHIDHLTEVGHAAGAWIFPGGNECALVRRLSALDVLVPGFGSSDCPTCRSHLLYARQVLAGV
jgi:Uri superfamily endonuclease